MTLPNARTSTRSRSRSVAVVGIVALAAGALTVPAQRAEAAPRGGAAEVTQCPYVAHDLRNLPAMEERIGSEITCAVVFHDYMDSWDTWERPWFASSPIEHFRWDEFAREDGNTLVMTLNLVPKHMPSDWRTRGAEGQYDHHIRRLAENLVARGLGTEVIRLGSEANGTWRPDHIGHSVAEHREWARYWRHFVEVTRTVPGANFVFDWNVNSGYRAVPFEQYYPGDDVVDIIGIDQYDSLPDPRTNNRWRELARQRGGIEELAAFARAHGKPLSLPEVGLVDEWDHGAGDNPRYVRGLARLVARNDVAYMGYFDKNVGGTLRLSEVPRSAAAWRRSFGNGDALAQVIASKTRD